jgi:hypothetical protein
VTTNFGKGQSSPGKKGNKTLRREAMVKKAKAHVAEAEEEDHDEEDEKSDGDQFEEEYDSYMMSFEEQEVHGVNVEQEGIKRKEVNSFDVGHKKESEKCGEEEVNVEQEDSEKEEERSVGDKWVNKKTKVKGTKRFCICSTDDYGLLNILKNDLKSSIDELNDMTFPLRKHDENKETVKTMKKTSTSAGN